MAAKNSTTGTGTAAQGTGTAQDIILPDARNTQLLTRLPAVASSIGLTVGTEKNGDDVTVRTNEQGKAELVIRNAVPVTHPDVSPFGCFAVFTPFDSNGDVMLRDSSTFILSYETKTYLDMDKVARGTRSTVNEISKHGGNGWVTVYLHGKRLANIRVHPKA